MSGDLASYGGFLLKVNEIYGLIFESNLVNDCKQDGFSGTKGFPLRDSRTLA